MRPLVVLDLNGVLIYRVYNRPNLGSLSLRKISLNNYSIYLRPHLELFLDTLFEKYDVAVYTSTSRKNATDILSILFTPVQLANLKFTWFRDRTRLDPEYNTNPKIKDFDTVKMVDDILSCPEINSHRKYSKNNVIMIDDSAQKLRFNAKGNLIVSCFHPDNFEDVELMSCDDELLKVLERLEELLLK